MSQAMHCDGPHCYTWTKPGYQADGFLTVIIHDVMDSTVDFCSWDCMAKYAAEKSTA